jgi:hypothetical protein
MPYVDSKYFQQYIVQLNRETNLSTLNLIFRRFNMSVLACIAIRTVVRVVLVRHLFGGVRGTVIDGGRLPLSPVEELKEQLRASILERRGCMATEEVPQMEPIEVVLPPNLDLKEMAQKRGHLKGVTTIDVHHRAVLKPEVQLEIVQGTPAEKGVTVEVIADDAVLPETPVNAEIVIFGPRAGELEAAAQAEMPYAGLEFEVASFEKADLRFWDNFFARIAQKSHVLDMLDDAHLLGLKDKYSKGYHPIREMGTDVYGIVHVTKNSMNALYLTDRESGTFRTVTATKRFNEADEVGVLEAKAFLNGRY